jgi:DNA-binding transcriptional regulator YbjK
MKQETGVVKIEVNAKEFSAPYSCAEFENSEDVLGHLASADAEALKKFFSALNYGIKLKAIAVVRGQLNSQAAGPDRAMEQLVKAMVKQYASIGKTITEDQAKAAIAAMSL